MPRRRASGWIICKRGCHATIDWVSKTAKGPPLDKATLSNPSAHKGLAYGPQGFFIGLNLMSIKGWFIATRHMRGIPERHKERDGQCEAKGMAE